MRCDIKFNTYLYLIISIMYFKLNDFHKRSTYEEISHEIRNPKEKIQ
jgi:hypothetical protein